MDRALKVQGSLPQQYPSCVKPMLRSHVSGGFWLGLPRKFCNLHMPNMDSSIVLVDEHGKGYDVKYLVNKNGLSGGWRGFSIAKGLMESDVVIFQVIERCKLKVLFLSFISDCTLFAQAFTIFELYLFNIIITFLC